MVAKTYGRPFLARVESSIGACQVRLLASGPGGRNGWFWRLCTSALRRAGGGMRACITHRLPAESHAESLADDTQNRVIVSMFLDKHYI